MLTNKNAVIYGAGGAIGGAVARAFAREGARVFLTGSNQSKLEALAKEILTAGGNAESAQVNALEEKEVDQHQEGRQDRTPFHARRLGSCL
jgi:NAD(P)-dependent dehydrogenase (short-subunit alcohol dehydrogenase family)